MTILHLPNELLLVELGGSSEYLFDNLLVDFVVDPLHLVLSAAPPLGLHPADLLALQILWRELVVEVEDQIVGELHELRQVLYELGVFLLEVGIEFDLAELEEFLATDVVVPGTVEQGEQHEVGDVQALSGLAVVLAETAVGEQVVQHAVLISDIFAGVVVFEDALHLVGVHKVAALLRGQLLHAALEVVD